MKIVNAEESKSLIVGASDTHTMTTGDASLIFHLLSENLYSDGVLASFREIITNAWDSHIVSGCTDISVKVTVKDNTCTIEDSGSGIPHDLFKTLYGTLGGTNKDECNNTTGGMGIGKLAPLTVCDNFIVINKHGGKSVTYSINKGTVESQGVHTITTLNECPTDSTGLTVIFTVNADIDNSINSIFHFLVTSDIRASFSVETSKNLFERELEPLRSNYPFCFIPRYMSSSKAHVRWGNNTYDASEYLSKGFTDSLEELLECNNVSVIFKIPYGSYLNITPNREHLIKSEHNEKVIKDVLKDIEKDIKKNKETFIYNSINSRRKELIKYNNLKYKIAEYYVISNPIVESFFFNLKTISFEDSITMMCMYVPQHTYMSKILPGGLGLQLKRTYDPKTNTVDVSKTKKYRKLVRLFHEYGLNPKTRIHVPGYFNRSSAESYYIRLLLASNVEIGRTKHTSGDFLQKSVGIKLGVRQNQQEFAEKLKIILHDVNITYLNDIPSEKKTPTSSRKRSRTREYVSLTNHINGNDSEENRKWKGYVSSDIADFLKKVIQTKTKMNKGVIEFLERNGGTDNIAVAYHDADFDNLNRRKITHLSNYNLRMCLMSEVNIKPSILGVIYSLRTVSEIKLPEITNRKNNYFRVILELLEGDAKYKKFTKNELVILNWLIDPAALRNVLNYHSKPASYYHVYDYKKALILLNDTPAIQKLKQTIITQEKITYEN